MKREDCKKGMIVQWGDDMCRGVVIKINPKMAKVTTLDAHKGQRAGLTWRVPYSMLWPVVGGQEIGSEMAMRSFANPNDPAVKAWVGNQTEHTPIGELSIEDEFIMRAICELHAKLDGLEGKERFYDSQKLHLLFRALGRDISQEQAAEWFFQKNAASAQ